MIQNKFREQINTYIYNKKEIISPTQYQQDLDTQNKNNKNKLDFINFSNNYNIDILNKTDNQESFDTFNTINAYDGIEFSFL